MPKTNWNVILSPFSLVNLVKVNEFHLLWPTSNDVDRLQFLLWDWQWLTQRNMKYQVWTLLSSLNRNLLGFGKRCASYYPSLHNKEKSRISTIISKCRKQDFILQTKPDIKVCLDKLRLVSDCQDLPTTNFALKIVTSKDYLCVMILFKKFWQW